LILVCQERLKGTSVQLQVNDIAGGEGVLWQVREEAFGDDPCACYPHRALFLPCRMRGDDHATGHAIGSHWEVWAIGEAARHLAFGTLLERIRRQVARSLSDCPHLP